MNEDYAKYLDENSAKELLDLILSYLENPIEARKSNPRILSPMIRIYFRKSDQLQNMSTSDRNFWHEIFCSLLWWELDHRAQHPATTKVNIFQKTYGGPVKILIDGLDVSSDKMLENPDLSVEVTIELQDEENTELQSLHNILPETRIRDFADKQGGPPKRLLEFYTSRIFTICLTLSSEESLRELLLSKTSPRTKYLARRLIRTKYL